MKVPDTHFRLTRYPSEAVEVFRAGDHVATIHPTPLGVRIVSRGARPKSTEFEPPNVLKIDLIWPDD